MEPRMQHKQRGDIMKHCAALAGSWYIECMCGRWRVGQVSGGPNRKLTLAI